MQRLENPRPDHNILELLQRHPLVNTSAPIRLENHIPQQVLPNPILLQLPRNPPQVIKRNGAIRAAREQMERCINLSGPGIAIVIVVIPGTQFRSRDGEKGAVGDVAGAGGIDGGENGLQF